MSNLGTIYELNLSKYIKNKYPIVYANDTYYYYKVYGNDILSSSRKDRISSYERFKEKYQQGKYNDYNCVLIYVNKNVIPDFSFVDGFSHEELSASEETRKEQQLIDGIDRCKAEITRMTNCNEAYKKMIVQNNSVLEKLQQELLVKQDKLIKFRESRNQND